MIYDPVTTKKNKKIYDLVLKVGPLNKTSMNLISDWFDQSNSKVYVPGLKTRLHLLINEPLTFYSGLSIDWKISCDFSLCWGKISVHQIIPLCLHSNTPRIWRDHLRLDWHWGSTHQCQQVKNIPKKYKSLCCANVSAPNVILTLV